MKILMCVTIAFCCGYVGIAICHEYDKKLAFYKELLAFLQFLSVKIAFSKDMLAECINGYVDTNMPKNKKFYLALAQMAQNGNIQQNVMHNVLAKLTKSEEDEIFCLINNLGISDVITQKEILQAGIASCKLKIDACTLAKKTKGDVYKKLGICAGLVICILLY